MGPNNVPLSQVLWRREVVLSWLKRDELGPAQQGSCPDEDWGDFPVLGGHSKKDFKASRCLCLLHTGAEVSLVSVCTF